MFKSLAERIDIAFTNEKKDVFSHRVWLYTILFLVMFLVFCFPVFIQGHTFIGREDGLVQQYMFFLLEGEWLRQLLNNIFMQHQFIIPMWNDHVGYGADYINSMMNTLGNPINLLSVFANPTNNEFVLQATIPITLYLAGLSFLYFCQYHKINCYGSVLGAVTYVFSGFTCITFWQIFMLYPLVLAPLVITGADKIFDGKSPVMLIIGAAFTFLCGAYTAYVMTIVLFFYCIIKWWIACIHKVGVFFTLFAKVVASLFVGALIAAILVFPSIMGLLSQSRLSLDRSTLPFYSLGYYLQLFLYSNSVVSAGSQCFIGFTPLAFIAFLYAWLTKGKHFLSPAAYKVDTEESKNSESIHQLSQKRVFLALIVLMTIMICFPIFGKMFNGFAYATNRWVWAYTFVAAALVSLGISQALSASFEVRRKIGYILFGYVIICCVLIVLFNQVFAEGYALLLLGVFVLLAQSKTTYARAGMVVVAIVSCAVMSFSFSRSVAGGQLTIGEAADMAIYNNPARIASETLSDSDYGRVDTGDMGDRSIRNEGIAADLRMTNFYNSLYTEDVDRFHTDLGLSSSPFNFEYTSLAGRLPIEVVTGSNAFIVSQDKRESAPAIYDQVVGQGLAAGKNYLVLKSNHVPGLAFVYPSAISQSQFDDLSLTDRQEAVLRSVVLDDNQVNHNGVDDRVSSQGSIVSNNVDASTAATSDVSRNQTIEDNIQIADLSPDSDRHLVSQISPDIIVDHDEIIVKKPHAKIQLSVDIPAGEEGIAEFYGLQFWGQPLTALQTPQDRSNMHTWQKINQSMNEMLNYPADIAQVTCSSGGQFGIISQRNHNNDLYGGKFDWIVDLGNSNEDRHEVTLDFSQVGTYSLSQMNIKAESNDALIKDADNLCQTEVKGLTFQNNKYTCTADGGPAGGYLYFSIPYSSGWKATVDGRDVQILKANEGFMAMDVSPGIHDVELTYEKPYLFDGFIISSIGIFIFIVICIWNHNRNRNQGEHSKVHKRVRTVR